MPTAEGMLKMTDPAITRAILVLRLTLALFLLQWGVEKFVMPGNTPMIWGYFYGFSIPQVSAYVFGVIEIVLAICLALGLFPTVAYGASAALHAVTVVVSVPVLTRPFADPINHLFIASVPVLGAFVALFLLRKLDRPVFAR
jgi:putative oxidoreductase